MSTREATGPTGRLARWEQRWCGRWCRCWICSWAFRRKGSGGFSRKTGRLLGRFLSGRNAVTVKPHTAPRSSPPSRDGIGTIALQVAVVQGDSIRGDDLVAATSIVLLTHSGVVTIVDSRSIPTALIVHQSVSIESRRRTPVAIDCPALKRKHRMS